LCSRALTAADPFDEVGRAADESEGDPTADVLIESLPEDATVCVVGWPDLVAEAVVRRGDVCVLAVDCGDGAGFARRLHRSDVEAEVVSAAGVAAAAAAADVVLVESVAAGPDGMLATLGARAAAATAYCAEVPVWFVAGVGQRLPGPTWQGMLERLGEQAEPWDLDHEYVPLGLASHVVGPGGLEASPGDLGIAECAVAFELLRSVAF
jgi:hypothetical protein